jgi:hypothetical protein
VFRFEAGSTHRSSASAISSAERNLREAFRSMARCTISSTAAGTSLTRDRIDGREAWICIRNNSDSRELSKGSRPVINSNRTTPNEYRSESPVTG